MTTILSLTLPHGPMSVLHVRNRKSKKNGEILNFLFVLFSLFSYFSVFLSIIEFNTVRLCNNLGWEFRNSAQVSNLRQKQAVKWEIVNRSCRLLSQYIHLNVTDDKLYRAIFHYFFPSPPPFTTL